jgi:hypothetical protein
MSPSLTNLFVLYQMGRDQLLPRRKPLDRHEDREGRMAMESEDLEAG